MDLFSQGEDQGSGRLLADRMRPGNLDEYIGQEHIVGKGKLLRERLKRTRSLLSCCTGLRAAAKPLWPISYRITPKVNSCG